MKRTLGNEIFQFVWDSSGMIVKLEQHNKNRRPNISQFGMLESWFVFNERSQRHNTLINMRRNDNHVMLEFKVPKLLN